MNYNSDSDSDLTDEETTKLDSKIEVTSIRSFYDQYLKSNILLLQPEYQREFCWSQIKQNTFIGTIMNKWIIPNIVIYKLSKQESKQSKYLYECIDGQHRLVTIKNYIENVNNRLYYKDTTGIKYYYNSSNLKTGYKNLNSEELDIFNTYQLCINIIQTDNKEPLQLNTKCKIFNLLQNGEPVSMYEKIKNYDNPIINFIRDNKIINFLYDLNFNNFIIYKKEKRNFQCFNLFFIIRSFLILDKKNLNVNFLDFNIKKSIESNNYKGTKLTEITTNINDIYVKFKEIIVILSNIKHKFIPELAYIIICIYANFTLKKVNKLINDIDFIATYNNKLLYKENNGSVTTIEKVIKVYNEIIKKFN